MGAYSWEVFSRDEFENLFEMKKPEKVATRFLSDHWLTGGEIWSLCGLEKYGKPAKLSIFAPFQQSVVSTAGNISALLS